MTITTTQLTALEGLADVLLDLESPEDLGRLLEALRPLLEGLGGWAELAAMIDVCPVHLTDVDTCRDDELDCQAARS